MGKDIMLDFHALRFGSLVKSWMEADGRCYRILPFATSAFKGLGFSKNDYITIKKVNPNENVNMITLNTSRWGLIDKRDDEEIFNIKILLTAENGEAYFLNEVLGNKIPEILNMMKNLNEQTRIERSANKAMARMLSKGQDSMIKDLSSKVGMVAPKPRQDEDQRRRHGGDGFGQ